MGIAAGVQDNAIVVEPNPVQLVDQLSFHIALEKTELHLREGLHKRSRKFLERAAAVNFRFPPAQEVEVRTVDDGDLHDANLIRILRAGNKAYTGRINA